MEHANTNILGFVCQCVENPYTISLVFRFSQCIAPIVSCLNHVAVVRLVSEPGIEHLPCRCTLAEEGGVERIHEQGAGSQLVPVGPHEGHHRGGDVRRRPSHHPGHRHTRGRQERPQQGAQRLLGVQCELARTFSSRETSA